MFDFLPLTGYSIGASPNLIEVSSFAGSTGAATGTVPSSKQNGDIILAHAITAGGTDGAIISAPAGEGWNSVVSVEETVGTNCVGAVFWKRWGQIGQTDNTSTTFTPTSGDCGLVLAVIRGAKASGDVIGTEYTTNHGSGGTSLTISSAIPASNLRLGITLFGASIAAGNISGTSGTFWAQMYAGSSYATTAGSDRGMAANYNRNIPLVGAAASSATASTTMNGWTVIQVLIRTS